MKWVLLIIACASMGAISACATSERRALDGRGIGDPRVPARMVAFDNVYGQVDKLPVHVTVDAGAEQSLIAVCDARTCTFTLPLTSSRHELAISVEQNGQRSAPTMVTLDASAPR